MRTLYYFLDTLLVGIYGITIIDLFAFSNGLGFITNGVQIALAIGGLIYLFGIKIPHDRKMNKMKREEKRLEIEKLKRENKKKKK